MTEKTKLSLGGVWLIASLSALLLPVFIPSYPHGAGFFSNIIETSFGTMFILSFPSSLIGLPVLLAADRILGIDPGSISGMYTNLTILFALGIVQWFWLVPRIWFKKPLIQTLENSVPELQLAQRLDFDRFSSRERTPVERVLDEDRE